MKTFLGIDPGSIYGWATYSKKEEKYGHEKFEGLLAFETRTLELVSYNDPVAVVTCRAMGPHAQVTRFHAAMAGVVELVCERCNIPYFDVADMTMRKTVIGKGNAKKPEIMAFLKIENEHAADAMVAARYLTTVIL